MRSQLKRFIRHAPSSRVCRPPRGGVTHWPSTIGSLSFEVPFPGSVVRVVLTVPKQGRTAVHRGIVLYCKAYYLCDVLPSLFVPARSKIAAAAAISRYVCVHVRLCVRVFVRLYARCTRTYIRGQRLRWNRKFVIGGEKKIVLSKLSVRRKEECPPRPVCSTYKEVISPGVEFPSRAPRIAFSFVRAVSRIARTPRVRREASSFLGFSARRRQKSWRSQRLADSTRDHVMPPPVSSGTRIRHALCDFQDHRTAI